MDLYLSKQDYGIIRFKALIRLRTLFNALMACNLTVDVENALHIVCYDPSVANKLMSDTRLLRAAWIVLGTCKVSIWVYGNCFWESDL